MDFIKKNPVFRVPFAVTGFRSRVAVQRPLMQTLFDSIPVAKAKFDAAQDALRPYIEQNQFQFDDPAFKKMLWESGAHKSLYEDSASTIIILAAASLERFYEAAGERYLDRGVPTYLPEITFARAVIALRDQYTHLGEWLHTPKKHGEKGRELLALLVGNPLATDAAAQFLTRGDYMDCSKFQEALFSCSDGIVEGDLIPDGRDGIPQITLKWTPSAAPEAE